MATLALITTLPWLFGLITPSSHNHHTMDVSLSTPIMPAWHLSRLYFSFGNEDSLTMDYLRQCLVCCVCFLMQLGLVVTQASLDKIDVQKMVSVDEPPLSSFEK